MTKKIIGALVLAGVLSLAYYVFFVPYEFTVRLSVQTLPGDIIQTIRLWSRSIKGSEIVEVNSLRSLTQDFRVRDRRYLMQWNFEEKDDSTTAISLRVTEPRYALRNKFLVPFQQTPIEQDAGGAAREFLRIMKEHLEITRVEVQGEAEVDSSSCICTELTTPQIEKANGMMAFFVPISSFVATQGLEAAGRPSIRVRQWDHNKGELNFLFCFPVHKAPTTLPARLQYIRFPAVKTLKANFYGNYITSDRAWYELIKYAEQNGYEVEKTPIEIFHDNPRLGINEVNWRAEVHLPIK